jgi:redox-sensitive bicupin YhaK (pirin superfamily)
MTHLGDGEERAHAMAPGRHAWLHVARGALSLNGHPLDAGDGAAVSEEAGLRLVGRGDAEVLLFDLA